MEIRQFTPEDAESAARLYIQSAEHHARLAPDFYRVPPLEAVVTHYEDVAERIRAEPFNCFVAESDSTVVGMVEVWMQDRPSSSSMLRPRRIATADLVVDSRNRRQGIGRTLMERAESWAHDQGASSLMLDMLRANEPALALYTRLGYQDHGALLLKRHIGPR